MADLFTFRRFLLDEDEHDVTLLRAAAVDKLQTLYPGKRLTCYDDLTIGIETDSLYSDTGIDIYDLGLVDGEIPAVCNRRTDEVLTFRA